MRRGVRQVEQERFVLVGLDESNGLAGELLGQQAVLERLLDQVVAAPDFVRLVVG